MLVLLLAVGERVEVAAPHQSFDHDAAFGGVAEQFGDGRSALSHPLVGITPPVGEEQVVAGAQASTSVASRSK